MCDKPVSLGRHEVILAPAALMLGARLRQDTLLHVCKHVSVWRHVAIHCNQGEAQHRFDKSWHYGVRAESSFVPRRRSSNSTALPVTQSSEKLSVLQIAAA